MNTHRIKIILILLAISVSVFSVNTFAQFIDETPLGNITAQQTTGEKPQSKVWYYGGYWWTVAPVSSGASGSGTYIFRLDGSSWTQLNLRLDSNTNIHADTKVVGDTTHIILFQQSSLTAKLYSVQFVSGSPPTYELWSGRSPNLVDITLESGTETAVIEMDSNNRMWLANAGTSQIYAHWSDYPYDTWNTTTQRVKLNSSSVKDDDICSVTAFGGNKIGVLWSNQNDKKFYFKYHNDTDGGSIWSILETAASDPSGGKLADDHINFAVSGDGTIYAAIKTSYDSDTKMTIGLLERKTDATWNLYEVTKSGATRPIALLDDTNNKIFVIYTACLTCASDIYYKWSYTSTISFSAASILATGTTYNNTTSTKQTFNSNVVILYSHWTGSDYSWDGKIPGSPFPVELAFFNGILNGNKVELRWRTETEVNNYGFNIERKAPFNPPEGGNNDEWTTIGFVEGHGNSNSPKYYDYVDTDITNAGEYNYRLKQIDNDGTFEYSDVVTVQVATPNNFYLSQNYPNPFNPTTRINFSLPERQIILLRVYNTVGELVTELVNEVKEAGSYSVTFDASNLPSGTYFYRISAGKYSAAKKMSLIK